MADEVADTMVTDRKERIARNEVLFVPDVEDIVSEGERFFVVSKHLEEAAPALETDPRA